MTSEIQVSFKKSDGTIYVVGGSDASEFTANLAAVLGDQELVDEVFADMTRCLTPVAAGGQPAPTQFYTPPATYDPAAALGAQPTGGPRTSTVPVAVKIPWADKPQADPFLTPLKGSRQAQWDAANKQWILMPGVDLAPFARWLPPGA